MNCARRSFARILGWCGALAVLGLTIACENLADSPGGPRIPPQPGMGSDILRPGDKIRVTLADIPSPPPPYDVTIGEDGKITLHQNKEFEAAGKTTRALQTEIQRYYVPNLYVQMTVTVQADNRVFYVEGDVKQPNRYPHVGDMTVLKGIATAGGFTDFAKKSKVTVTRAETGKQDTVNCDKARSNPSLDLPIYPGDHIFVPRRL